MERSYEKKIEVRWSDVDHNQHVRHSAYYDFGAHVRIRFFQDLGYDGKDFQNLGLGPIIFQEQCSFIKELSLYDTIRVNFLRGEISDDGARWTLYHEIFNSQDKKAAHIKLSGAWMDMLKRKLTVPPDDFAKGFKSLPLGTDFVYK
ncbi:MAG: acyl-CoA thioesterase [Flavobacteriales bacterium]|nr:acyl-CoA thioesterase [Flavobacteriales bacterium]